MTVEILELTHLPIYIQGSLDSLTLNFGVSDFIIKLNMQAQLCTIAGIHDVLIFSLYI